MKRTNNLMVYIRITNTVKITEIAIKETVRDVITIESIFVI